MPAIRDYRDYNMSDAELCQFASNLVGDMTRDISEFGGYGVEAADVSAMQALGDAFEVFPSDEMLEGDVVIATNAKNALRESVLDDIRKQIMRVEIKWGAKSGQYKRLGVKGINNMTDIKLLYTSRRVHTVLAEYLSDLSDEGLTQAMLDAMQALTESFELAMNTKHDKVNNRDNATFNRVEKGNELYSSVVKYCDIGKRIWFGSDPAKYNDYVIYKAENPGLGKVKKLAYDVPSTKFVWDILPLAVDYQLEQKGNAAGAEWSAIYEGSNAYYVADPGAGHWFFRCRGHNDIGYGDWSDELEVHLLA